MFELTLSKQALLTPLITVAGAVDKKPSSTILSHILVKLIENQLHLTATDLEIEMTASIGCDSSSGEGEITVPAKKMIDIVRSLDEEPSVTIIFDESLVSIKQGRSKFKLVTLPADDYPNTKDEVSEIEFSMPGAALMHLLQSTHFALSQQDVRVFLNCLLLEIESDCISAIATDAHRMAVCRVPWASNCADHKLLIPRKGVQEMMRVLTTINDELITVSAGKNHIKILNRPYRFSSKLVEARFPPYNKIIPKQQNKSVLVEKEMLKRALSRIIILANEKSKAVLLHIQPQQLTLIANNQEQEEAIESLEVITEGDELKIGINASYLLDVLTHMQDGVVKLSMSESDISVLVESVQDAHYLYVIMPMKI